jgi:hypothetical protein
MMSAPTAVHLAMAASATALDLNERIILRRRRGVAGRNPQPRGSRHRHCQRRHDYRGCDQ